MACRDCVASGVAAAAARFFPTYNAGLRPRLTPSRRCAAVSLAIPGVCSTLKIDFGSSHSLCRAARRKQRRTNEEVCYPQRSKECAVVPTPEKTDSSRRSDENLLVRAVLENENEQPLMRPACAWGLWPSWLLWLSPPTLPRPLPRVAAASSATAPGSP